MALELTPKKYEALVPHIKVEIEGKLGHFDMNDRNIGIDLALRSTDPRRSEDQLLLKSLVPDLITLLDLEDNSEARRNVTHQVLSVISDPASMLREGQHFKGKWKTYSGSDKLRSVGEFFISVDALHQIVVRAFPNNVRVVAYIQAHHHLTVALRAWVRAFIQEAYMKDHFFRGYKEQRAIRQQAMEEEDLFGGYGPHCERVFLEAVTPGNETLSLREKCRRARGLRKAPTGSLIAKTNSPILGLAEFFNSQLIVAFDGKLENDPAVTPATNKRKLMFDTCKELAASYAEHNLFNYAGYTPEQQAEAVFNPAVAVKRRRLALA